MFVKIVPLKTHHWEKLFKNSKPKVNKKNITLQKSFDF